MFILWSFDKMGKIDRVSYWALKNFRIWNQDATKTHDSQIKEEKNWAAGFLENGSSNKGKDPNIVQKYLTRQGS